MILGLDDNTFWLLGAGLITVAGVLFIAAIAAFYWFYWRKRQPSYLALPSVAPAYASTEPAHHSSSDRIRPKDKPRWGNTVIPAYLIGDDNLCAHTRFEAFSVKGKSGVPQTYYWLEANKRVYFPDEIFMGDLTQEKSILNPKAANPIHINKDGKIEVWRFDLTPRTRAEVDTMGRNKLKEREGEIVHMKLKKKYLKPNMMAIWISIVVTGLAIGLLCWFVWGTGVPSILGQENAGAAAAQAAANSHLVNLANLSNATANLTAVH